MPVVKKRIREYVFLDKDTDYKTEKSKHVMLIKRGNPTDQEEKEQSHAKNDNCEHRSVRVASSKSNNFNATERAESC